MITKENKGLHKQSLKNKDKQRESYQRQGEDMRKTESSVGQLLGPEGKKPQS